MADLSEQIETNAGQPQSTTFDGLANQNRPLHDLIEADKHLKSNAAASNPARALRFAKIVSPAAVGDC